MSKDSFFSLITILGIFNQFDVSFLPNLLVELTANFHKYNLNYLSYIQVAVSFWKALGGEEDDGIDSSGDET